MPKTPKFFRIVNKSDFSADRSYDELLDIMEDFFDHNDAARTLFHLYIKDVDRQAKRMRAQNEKT